MMNQTEYEGLVKRCAPGAWRAAVRVSRNEAAASDAVQDVFAQLLDGRIPERRLRDLRDSCGGEPEALKVLAVRTVLNAKRSEGRRTRRERNHAMENTAKSAPGAGELASRAEVDLALSQAVAELPETLRSIVTLRFEEGLSFASIGSAIGASESTAHDRLSKALERLRAMLKGTGLGGAGLGALASAPGGLEQSLASWGESSPIPDVPAGLAGELVALHSAAASNAAAAGAAWTGKFGILAGTAAALGAAVLSGALMAQGSARPERTPEPDSQGAASAPQDPSGGAPALDGDVATAERVPAADTQEDGSSQTGGAGPEPFVLTGKVVDGGRTGVASATVRASTVERSGKRALWSSSVTAAADGTFELPVPFEGALEGAAGAELILDAGHLGYLHLGKSRVRAVPGGSKSVELELALPSNERAGDFVLDVLVRGPDGEPLPGTLVELTHVAPRDKATVGPGVPFPQWTSTEKWLHLKDGAGRTDADGRVRLSGKRLGAKSLWVEPQGNFAPMRESLAIIAEGDQAHDAWAQAGARLTGTVAWADAGAMTAEELKNVQISAVLELNRWRSVVVQPDGTFDVEGLGSHAIEVRVGPNWGWPPKLGDRPSRARLEVTPGGAPLDLRMKRSTDPRDIGLHDVELHGDAIDAVTGESVGLAPGDVFTWPLWDLPEGDLELDLFPNLFRPPPVQRMVSAGGEVLGIHEDSLDPGPYMIQVSTRNHGFGVIGPIVAGPAEVRSGLEVKLGVPGSLDVTVVDDRGRPVAGAWVFVTGSGPYSDSVVASVHGRYSAVDGKGTFHANGGRRTDSHGKAQLTGLPDGLKCTVGVCHPGFSTGRSGATVVAGGEAAQVRVTMTR